MIDTPMDPNIYPSGIHLEQVAIATARERVRRAEIGLALLAREAPELVGSAAGIDGPGIPLLAEAPGTS